MVRSVSGIAPKLEALAAERNGGFKLAKVNTDDNPQLAQDFQVSGIPAVFGIRDGKVLDAFTGVLPSDEICAFIDRLTPTAEESKIAQALELEGHDPATAEKIYRELLGGSPDNPLARLGLARLLLARPGNEHEAEQHLTGVSFGDHIHEATRLRTILHLRQGPHADADLQTARATVAVKPTDAAAHYALARSSRLAASTSPRSMCF